MDSVTYYRNVFFICISRFSAQGAVVMAHTTYNFAEVDVDGVKIILDRSSINTDVPNRLHHAEIATNSWYFLTDDMGLVYTMCVATGYPSRLANACLTEVQTGFQVRVGEKASTGKSGIFNLACAGMFSKVTRKFDNVLEVDTVGNIPVGKIHIEHLDIDDNDPFIQNCAKLFTADKTSEDILKAAGLFKNNETFLKKKSWMNKLFAH